MSRRRQTFEIRVTENDIFENNAFYATHVEYIAKRFKDEHNVIVIDHRKLNIQMSLDEKAFRIVGEVGKAITDRQG